MFKKYYYKLLAHYLSLYIRPENSVTEINPSSDLLIKRFSKGSFYLFPPDIDTSKNDLTVSRIADLKSFAPDYILLNGNIHFEKDIQVFFDGLQGDCKDSTRIIIIYFNSLWMPLIKLATFLKLRTKTPEQNWISHEDVGNFMRLSNFEIIRRDNKILLPFWLPVISYLFNR